MEEQLLQEIKELRKELEELKPLVMQKQAFTAQEVGQMLGVSDRHIYNLVTAGELKAIRVGHLLRIPKLYIDEFLKG